MTKDDLVMRSVNFLNDNVMGCNGMFCPVESIQVSLAALNAIAASLVAAEPKLTEYDLITGDGAATSALVLRRSPRRSQLVRPPRTPTTCGGMFNLVPMLGGCLWCLRSDVVTNSRLQATAASR